LIGSIDTGRWVATRMLPPVAAEALADPLALAPALADADAAGADALGLPPLHAAITAETVGSPMPMTAARRMNWRRVIPPFANVSTRSSCCGVAERRTGSSRE